MKNILLGILVINMLASCNVSSQTNEKDMVPIGKIEEMYSNMKSNGIDVKSDFLYGYFFVSSKKKKLEQAVPALEAMSFQLVGIYQSDDKNWWLHVERIESHSTQTLFDLNKKLYVIADQFSIKYDGFDLGNPDPKKSIERDTYVVPEEFKAIDYLEDGFPSLLVGNTAFDRFPHKDEFRYFLRVTTPYKHDLRSMLPIENELEELGQFENFIEDNLNQNGIKNYYLIRRTYKGFRTFYIALSQQKAPQEQLELIREQGGQRDFEFEIIEDENWKSYTELRSKLDTD